MSTQNDDHWCLESIPSELLGFIVELAGGEAFYRIWLCGSLLLNKKLSCASGLLHYQSFDEFDIPFEWNRQITQLNGLRTLDLFRFEYGHLIDIKQLMEALPRSLVEVKIGLWRRTTEHEEENGGNGLSMDLGTFPHLTQLCLIDTSPTSESLHKISVGTFVAVGGLSENMELLRLEGKTLKWLVIPSTSCNEPIQVEIPIHWFIASFSTAILILNDLQMLRELFLTEMDFKALHHALKSLVHLETLFIGPSGKCTLMMDEELEVERRYMEKKLKLDFSDFRIDLLHHEGGEVTSRRLTMSDLVNWLPPSLTKLEIRETCHILPCKLDEWVPMLPKNLRWFHNANKLADYEMRWHEYEGMRRFPKTLTRLHISMVGEAPSLEYFDSILSDSLVELELRVELEYRNRPEITGNLVRALAPPYWFPSPPLFPHLKFFRLFGTLRSLMPPYCSCMICNRVIDFNFVLFRPNPPSEPCLSVSKYLGWGGNPNGWLTIDLAATLGRIDLLKSFLQNPSCRLALPPSQSLATSHRLNSQHIILLYAPCHVCEWLASNHIFQFHNLPALQFPPMPEANSFHSQE